MKIHCPVGSRVLLAAALYAGACGSDPPAKAPINPAGSPAAGQSGSGSGRGSSGSGGAAGSAGGSMAPPAGSAGSAGPVAGQSGGSSPDASAMGGASQPPVDAPVVLDAGADGSPPSATCDYTSKGNAGQIKLRFQQIPIMGVNTGDIRKETGTKDGFTDFRFVPGLSNEFLLIQKRGKLNHLRLDATGNMASLVKSHDIPGVFFNQDCGLISVAFDPQYQSNKLIYLGFCTAANASKLVRYRWDGEALSDPVDIMTWSTTPGRPAYHAIGSIGFESQGIMWLFHGEFENSSAASNLNSNLGKLLRIIPSRQPGEGGYTPAPDNPFVSDPKPKSAVFASGFRSPWRAVRTDRGHYVVGDVGDTTREEVNVVTRGGQNFGWPGGSGPCSGDCTGPVTYYRGPHDPYAGEGSAVKEARQGRAVWVGTQYGDCGNDRYGGALTGLVFFGDYYAGWFRGLVLDQAGKATKDVNLGQQGGVSAMAQRDDGYLYVLSLGPYGSAAGETAQLLRALPE